MCVCIYAYKSGLLQTWNSCTDSTMFNFIKQVPNVCTRVLDEAQIVKQWGGQIPARGSHVRLISHCSAPINWLCWGNKDPRKGAVRRDQLVGQPRSTYPLCLKSQTRQIIFKIIRTLIDFSLTLSSSHVSYGCDILKIKGGEKFFLCLWKQCVPAPSI